MGGQAPSQPSNMQQDPTYNHLMQAIQIIHNAYSSPQQRTEAQQVSTLM